MLISQPSQHAFMMQKHAIVILRSGAEADPTTPHQVVLLEAHHSLGILSF
jgi:hypothetical protein